MRSRRGAVVVAGLIAAIGCSDAVTVCTLLGCEGRITITFDSPPTTTFHLEAISVIQGLRTFDCTDATKCTSVDLPPDYTPDRLIVTITSPRGTTQFNLAPDYQNEYLNGPNCGVTCRSATVKLTLP